MEVLVAALFLFLVVLLLLRTALARAEDASLLRLLIIVWCIVAILWLLVFGHIPPLTLNLGA